MTTEAAFLATIAERPELAAPRLVYADWLEESGRSDLAFALRWCAKWKKWPHERTFHMTRDHETGELVPFRKVSKPFIWAWFSKRSSRYEDKDRPTTAQLPFLIFAAMRGSDHKFYPTRDEAIPSLAKALREIQQAVSIDA